MRSFIDWNIYSNFNFLTYLYNIVHFIVLHMHFGFPFFIILFIKYYSFKKILIFP